MVAYRILSLILIAAGAAITYSAKPIVVKLKLDEKMTADEAEELSEDKIKEYRFLKAMVRVKTAGLLLMLPGVFLALYAFR
ncbi:MAG TPA: hypothetical protein GXX26_02205 [Clostridiaceae bacterium]|nr:hypothetical protein [Clostridiaceae bacterium]